MATGGPCEVCGKPSTQQCSACGAAYYCSEPHQKQDWKRRHKVACRVASCCQRKLVEPSRDPFDYAELPGNAAGYDDEDDDPGKALSYLLVIENIRNGGNGVVPSTVQAYPQFLDSCLANFDRVKALLVKVREKKQQETTEAAIVVQQELNDCMNHFKIRYVLDKPVLDWFDRIRAMNTFASRDRVSDSVLEAEGRSVHDMMARLIVQVCRQEFGSKNTETAAADGEEEAGAGVAPWPYPWARAQDAQWSHAILARFGEVTDLDRQLQANLLESAVFPKATLFAMTRDDFVAAMRRRMG